ncbi:MAG TPA: murein biosynthesis integral membrane protein MurJ [Aggregatilineales bacterium]|nr:murein biosynthesis integral membrane protein MurJ [Aggregatilineales bacterium]
MTATTLPEKQDIASRNQRLAQSALVVMIAFGVAKIISLVQTVILSQVFGTGAEMDSYVTANVIPETIFTLIAGGVLAQAFIPLFSSLLSKNDESGAWKLASHVINSAFLLTFVASLLAFVLAPWFIGTLVAPGMEAETVDQAAGMMRVLLIGTLIFSVSGILMGILNSYNHFLTPAIAPAMYDIGILIGAMFLVRPFGIMGLAYGTVLGAALHLIVQLPALFRYPVKWRFALGWADPTLRRLVLLMLPRIADLGLFQITTYVLTTNIASRLGEGAISAQSWAWRIMQIPQTLIGTAIGTVIFPTLAALSEAQDAEGKRNAMSGALRYILTLTIPSAVLLILCGTDAVSLLERGAFTAESTALVYSALRFYALGVIVHSILEVAARSFFADKDTLTPFFIAFGGSVVNIITSLIFTGVLTAENPDPINVGGLALGNTLGVTFEIILLLFLLRRRWGGINTTELGRTTGKALAASLVMGLVVVIVQMMWGTLGLHGQGTLMTIIGLGMQIALGGMAFVIVAWFLRMDEFQQIIAGLRSRSPAKVAT